MSPEEKNKFDRMNNTSYLLRIILEQHKFKIQPIIINNDRVYHILKNGHTIGTLVSRFDEELNYTHNNIRLYKYFVEKFPKAENFLMSQYWVFNNDIRVKFDFDKFDDWCDSIDKYVEQLGVKPPISLDNNDTLNDSINRLVELVDEYDEKFTSNSLIKDIRKLLNENDRLNTELKNKEKQFFNFFVNLKL